MARSEIEELFYDRDAPKVDKRSRVHDSLDFVKMAKWVRVKSSNVRAIRYIAKLKHLEVEFLNKSVYRYYNVPPHTAKNMFDASSMGRFVWRQLRDRFPYQKVN